MECIDENYTLSTHFPYTLISPIHTNSEHFKENTLSTRFMTLVNLTPLFVCTHFSTTLPFRTPLSTRKFGRAGYSTFSSSRPPGDVDSCKGLNTINIREWWFITERGVGKFRPAFREKTSTPPLPARGKVRHPITRNENRPSCET